MKIFVTGHKGYIGSHLVELLKSAGHNVTGCDLDLFDGCGWEPVVPADRDLNKDVRLITPEDLAGHDCVMHLAALSNDPMGELDAASTYAINRDASIRIAQLAKKSGVPRFLLPPAARFMALGRNSISTRTIRLIRSPPMPNPRSIPSRRYRNWLIKISHRLICAMLPLMVTHRCCGLISSLTIS